MSESIQPTRGSVTLYQRTIDFVRSYILQNGLKEGDQLPTEAELVRMTDVSMVTVRRALAELTTMGVIRREQGKGTFIQPRRIEAYPASPGSLRAALTDGSRVLDTEFVSLEERVANLTELEVLQVGAEELVWDLRRIHSVDGTPQIIDRTVIPRSLSPELSVLYPDGDNGLFDTLSGKFGLEADQEEQVMIARQCTRYERDTLRIGDRDWVIEINGVSSSADGTPFAAFTQVLRAQSFRFRSQSSQGGVFLSVKD